MLSDIERDIRGEGGPKLGRGGEREPSLGLSYYSTVGMSLSG